MTKREKRRIAGYLKKYLPATLLERVLDPRSEFSRRWKLPVMLRMTLVGLMSGCRGLAEIESLSAQLSTGARRLLGVFRRLPDTTLRSTLQRLLPNNLREILHVVVYDAWRRKALPATEFPFHAISMDGKYVTLSTTGTFAQARTQEDGTTCGQLRTITSTLVTAASKPCIDAMPVRADTNEMGAFAEAFDVHQRNWPELAQLYMYDAGAASKENASRVVAAQRDYLFVINEFHPQMLSTIQLLIDEQPVAHREKHVERYAHASRPQKTLVKTIQLRSARPTPKNITLWEHARTIVKVTTATYEGDVQEKSQTRYYATSLPVQALSASQWLKLITLRWSVETTHQILDTTFAEDARPGYVKDELGALNFMLLRRLALTLLALYRGVTLRSEEHRTTPWKAVLKGFERCMLLISEDGIAGLKTKELAVPPAFS